MTTQGGMLSSFVFALILLGAASAQVAAPAYRPASLHYVNIGSQLAGDYRFGYDTGRGPLGQSFREEVRRADGSVQGSYGVIDDLGQKRVVTYSSGTSGSVPETSGNQLGYRLGSAAYGQPHQSTLQHDFDRLRQQLPLFSPSNYLQAKVFPAHNSILASPQLDIKRPVANVENRLPDPLLSDIVLPLNGVRAPERRFPNNYGFDRRHQASVPGYGHPQASYVDYQRDAANPGNPGVIASRVPETLPRADAKYQREAEQHFAKYQQEDRVSRLPQQGQHVPEYGAPKASFVEYHQQKSAAAQGTAPTSPTPKPFKSPANRVSRFAPGKASAAEYPQKSATPLKAADQGTISAKRFGTRRPAGALGARDDKGSVVAAPDLPMSEIRRVTNRPYTKVLARHADAKVADEEQRPVVPAAETDYYDTVAPFIDIERLSYDIGSGRNSA